MILLNQLNLMSQTELFINFKQAELDLKKEFKSNLN
jgi:hypothetical protein